jgi:hypothetical protein
MKTPPFGEDTQAVDDFSAGGADGVFDGGNPCRGVVELDRPAHRELLPARGDTREIFSAASDSESDEVFLHLAPVTSRFASRSALGEDARDGVRHAAISLQPQEGALHSCGDDKVRVQRGTGATRQWKDYQV